MPQLCSPDHPVHRIICGVICLFLLPACGRQQSPAQPADSYEQFTLPVVCDREIIALLSLPTGRMKEVARLSGDVLGSVSLSDDGNLIAIGRWSGTSHESEVSLIDPRDGMIRTLYTAPPNHLAFGPVISPDSRLIAFAQVQMDPVRSSEQTLDPRLVVIERSSGRMWHLDHAVPVQWVSSDRMLIRKYEQAKVKYAYARADDFIVVEPVNLGAELEAHAHLVALSPDGTLVAYSSSFKTEQGWNVHIAVSDISTSEIKSMHDYPGLSALGLMWLDSHRLMVSVETAQGLGVTASSDILVIDLRNGSLSPFRLECVMGGNSLAALHSFVILVEMTMESELEPATTEQPGDVVR